MLGRETEPPSGVIPGTVNERLTVTRTETAAVYLYGFQAWPSGFRYSTLLYRRAIDATHGSVTDEDLEFGVLFAGGDSASQSVGRSPRSEGATVLMAFEGGASYGHEGLTFRVTPLPRFGSVHFWFSWPARGIFRVSTSMDSRLLVDAAGRAIELW